MFSHDQEWGMGEEDVRNAQPKDTAHGDLPLRRHLQAPQYAHWKDDYNRVLEEVDNRDVEREGFLIAAIAVFSSIAPSVRYRVADETVGKDSCCNEECIACQCRTASKAERA